MEQVDDIKQSVTTSEPSSTSMPTASTALCQTQRISAQQLGVLVF
jgi:hypothetical protein